MTACNNRFVVFMDEIYSNALKKKEIIQKHHQYADFINFLDLKFKTLENITKKDRYVHIFNFDNNKINIHLPIGDEMLAKFSDFFDYMQDLGFTKITLGLDGMAELTVYDSSVAFCLLNKQLSNLKPPAIFTNIKLETKKPYTVEEFCNKTRMSMTNGILVFKELYTN